jgi:hypothetical protein
MRKKIKMPLRIRSARRGKSFFLPPDLRPFEIKKYIKGIGEYDTDDIPQKSIVFEENYENELPVDVYPGKLTQTRQERKESPVGTWIGNRLNRDELVRKIADDIGILVSLTALDKGFITRAVTVGTTAVRIIQAQFLKGYTLLNSAQAGSGNVIYIGNSGVTTTSGFPLLETKTMDLFIRENTEVYAIATSSLTLNILEWQ